MTQAALPAPPTPERLDHLNRELARLLRFDAAALVSTNNTAADDDIVLCGVVGGKDVGKSALINALAGRVISRDEEQVGEGTHGAVAFVHQDDEAAYRERLEAVARQTGHERLIQDVVTHDSDAIRRLVLVDLPDMTSTFEDHARVVRAVAPTLDRVVWLWDPVLAGDRSYAERVGRIVKDRSNLTFVLNKVDLLLRDEDDANADRLWEGWSTWFQSMVTPVLNGEAIRLTEADGADHRWYLVAAAYPEAARFADAARRSIGAPHAEASSGVIDTIATRSEADLARLRQALLQPLSSDEAARIKADNEAAEVDSDIHVIRRQFELERVTAIAGDASGVASQEVGAAFTDEAVDTIARRLSHAGRSDSELADRVLAARLEKWPVFPAMFWAVRGLVRWVGRRMVGAGGDKPVGTELCRIDGTPLVNRLDTVISRLRLRSADLLGLLREEPALPEPATIASRVEARLEEAAIDVDDEVVREALTLRRPPGILTRMLVPFVLIWFVLLQPFLSGLLRLPKLLGIIEGESLLASLTDPGTLVGALSVAVDAFGAGALLQGIGVVLLIYVVWLAVLFARAVRDVRRVRGVHPELQPEPDARIGAVYRDRVVAILDQDVHAPIVDPIRHATGRILAAGEELGVGSPVG